MTPAPAPKIVVLGANDKTSSDPLRQLRAEGVSLRALVHPRSVSPAWLSPENARLLCEKKKHEHPRESREFSGNLAPARRVFSSTQRA